MLAVRRRFILKMAKGRQQGRKKKMTEIFWTIKSGRQCQTTGFLFLSP